VDAAFGHDTALLTGPVASTIVAFAQSHAIDLIVMGTHGRSGIAHLLLGSVAERVVRTAPCPVLTVRHQPVPSPVAEIAARPELAQA
jgi:nucleotide-binding universal stress UspA family protein